MKPELLAPAGNLECAKAAVANGADAIYFGAPSFNARMRADNVQIAELPGLMRFLHANGVRGYVALNVLIFTDELAAVARLLDEIRAAKVDAVIVQDVGLARLATRAGLRVHASTQMTVTSPEGVAFAASIGAQRVVLARETSLKELARFSSATNPASSIPLEVFVHGALCVAYSGQCLTSEALGQRSANRGECAQACRMPYQLLVDGVRRDLGDRHYLLSPQDLAAVEVIPELIRLGVAAFKIEGRLKTPEYVAAITQIYRQAIDTAWEGASTSPDQQTRYRMEMAFSRGLYTGWMHGVNHQRLVHAHFGKKRGAFVGKVTKTFAGGVEVDRWRCPVHPGDGVVFDQGGDTEAEIGGRVFHVGERTLLFDRQRTETSNVRPGARIWKTDDPLLNKELRRSYADQKVDDRWPISIRARGEPGEPLRLTVTGPDAIVHEVESSIPIQIAERRPLTPAILEEQLGRLGNTPYRLANLECAMAQPGMLPLSELSRLRHAFVKLLDKTGIPVCGQTDVGASACKVLQEILPKRREQERGAVPPVMLSLLCRSRAQVEAGLHFGIREIFLDYEDLRRFPEEVAWIRRQSSEVAVFLATPRIQKAGEEGYFKLILRAEPDGVLIRNLGGLHLFTETGLRKIGDFSLNIANPLSADLFLQHDLERIVPAFDLNARQLVDLVRTTPPTKVEIVLHQHIPMFHMEHCVFAAFLSNGTDFTNCGRPCEKHVVSLRDRVGQEHPLLADVGCRNTLFNGRAQSGAVAFRALREAGAFHFRIDLLREDTTATMRILKVYADFAEGRFSPNDVAGQLQAANQIGVIEGTMAV
ncbi:MAG: DUF3656 domain-containing protein [Verrucomicrobiia bacterium]